MVWLLAGRRRSDRGRRAPGYRASDIRRIGAMDGRPSWRWGRSPCSQIVSDLQAFFKLIGLSPTGTTQFAPGTLGNLFHPLSVYESLGSGGARTSD